MLCLGGNSALSCHLVANVGVLGGGGCQRDLECPDNECVCLGVWVYVCWCVCIYYNVCMYLCVSVYVSVCLCLVCPRTFVFVNMCMCVCV